MKGMFKHVGIIVLVAAIGFSMTACDSVLGGGGGGGGGAAGGEPTPSGSHTHQWDTWTVTTAATCVARGVETRTCSLDTSHRETRDIPVDPNAHDWDWIETQKPTTTVDGVLAGVCQNNLSHAENRPAYATGTSGLAFELINGNAYRVRKGTVTSGVVNIPAMYRPDKNSPYLPVKEIGYTGDISDSGAFYNTAITDVVFQSDNVITIIGSYAFSECVSLTNSNLSIPAGVTSIGSYAFSNSGLKGVSIPAGVTFIGSYAFFKCTSLATVTFPTRVTSTMSIGSYAFSESGLTAVAIPIGVTSIGEYVFENCDKLKSVTLPLGLTSIGSYAFSGCTDAGLTALTIPESVTYIGSYAFSGCAKINPIFIPAGVMAVGDGAFKNWVATQTINVRYPNPTAADAAWRNNWRTDCGAIIKYWNGSTYELP